jgi:AcrR family transcriptional regulator
MARPKHEPGATPTRERLLAAAADAFADEGFAGATLASIAERAGVSRPSLLFHFASKELLYSAVVEQTFSAIGDALALDDASEADDEAWLLGLSAAFDQVMAAHPSWARIVLRELLTDGPEQRALAGLVGRTVDAVAEAVTARLGPLPAGLPARDAVLHVASASLLYAASPLRSAVWPAPPAAAVLVRRIFLSEAR